MARWAVFVGLTAIVITAFLALARLSQALVRGEENPPGRIPEFGAADAYPTEPDEPILTDAGPASESPESEPRATEPPRADGAEMVGRDPVADRPGRSPAERTVATGDDLSMSLGALLANVALTQGVFGALVVAAAWYTQVPASAFGLTSDPLSTGLPGVAVGVVLGVALYVANELAATSADAMGVEYDERLRSMLAPESTTGWLVLLVGVLPVIAGVEEFIFRAAVIGATTAGFQTSPWALAVVSSLAFALGHGAQGRMGVVVTGTLGLVLAAAFILTGSLLVVVVAHYLVNALEFLVHEWLEVEWTERLVG